MNTDTFLPIVRALAARYARTQQEFEDGVQAGLLAVLEGEKLYDPKRGPIWAWMTHRIQHAIAIQWRRDDEAGTTSFADLRPEDGEDMDDDEVVLSSLAELRQAWQLRELHQDLVPSDEPMFKYPAPERWTKRTVTVERQQVTFERRSMPPEVALALGRISQLECFLLLASGEDALVSRRPGRTIARHTLVHEATFEERSTQPTGPSAAGPEERPMQRMAWRTRLAPTEGFDVYGAFRGEYLGRVRERPAHPGVRAVPATDWATDYDPDRDDDLSFVGDFPSFMGAEAGAYTSESLRGLGESLIAGRTQWRDPYSPDCPAEEREADTTQPRDDGWEPPALFTPPSSLEAQRDLAAFLKAIPDLPGPYWNSATFQRAKVMAILAGYGPKLANHLAYLAWAHVKPIPVTGLTRDGKMVTAAGGRITLKQAAGWAAALRALDMGAMCRKLQEHFPADPDGQQLVNLLTQLYELDLEKGGPR